MTDFAFLTTILIFKLDNRIYFVAKCELISTLLGTM